MKATLSLPHAVQPFLQAQPIAGFCQVCVQPGLQLQYLVRVLLPHASEQRCIIVLQSTLMCFGGAWVCGFDTAAYNSFFMKLCHFGLGCGVLLGYCNAWVRLPRVFGTIMLWVRKSHAGCLA